MKRQDDGLMSGLRYTGVLGFLGGWIVILTSISRNPWFVFTENAFSDLGHPSANMPWVFNYGMILNGLLIILYGVYLVDVSYNKRGTVGGSFMMITGVFLVLIGGFPEGTKHHTFVSYWFFIMGAITVLTWGLALYRDPLFRNEGLIFIMMGILGPLGSALLPWPSIAAVEAYGIVIMDIWVIMMRHITQRFPA